MLKRFVSKVVGAVLTFILALNFCLTIAYASTYSDVADNDWHSDAIDYVTEIGLMEGVGNGSFQPDQPLTRAQVVALLYRLAGKPETTYSLRLSSTITLMQLGRNFNSRETL